MSAWTDDTVRRRQLWFPWATLAIGAIMAGAYVAIDFGAMSSMLAFGVVTVLLLTLTAATARARVTPRGATAALWGAVVASLVLRVLTGLVVTALGGGVAVVLATVACTVAPFVAVAATFLRRLR